MSTNHDHKRRRSPSPPHPSTTATATAASFPSYLTAPNLPPTIRQICQLIATTPASTLEQTLTSISPSLTPSDLELILKLSYSYPSSAIKFFRWSATHIRGGPTPYSWNLAVDLLGKNRLFSAMWDAVSSMLHQRILSLATFASIFSSYAAAGDSTSAIRAFDDMATRYGVPRDTPALNSLLSALCREGLPAAAHDVLHIRRNEVPPDGDSYAILLEGWENAGDTRRARATFDEMTDQRGWDPQNVPAYDSFLCTLLRDRSGGGSGLENAMHYLSILKGKRCYPGIKFFNMAMEEFEKADDVKGAIALWESLVGRIGCFPDAKLYNSMISVQCHANRPEVALKYLDEMVMYGAFPDVRTYNVLLKYLLKGRNTRDAVAIFDELVKNEFVPSEENCTLAVRVFVDAREVETAIKVWKCMVENGYAAVDSGNMLVETLKDLDMLPEACKFAEEMIDRRVKLSSASLSKLKSSLSKMGKGNIYDYILRKWKLH